MHRIVFLVSFLLLAVLSFAQRTAGNFEHVVVTDLTGDTRDYIDTIMPLSFISIAEGGLGCETGIYPATDSGYVTGNNQYGDLQKAQFFSLHQMGYSAPAYVQSVQVKAGHKSTVNGTGVVYVNVYAVDTNGFIPGELLATSQGLTLGQIDASGVGNTFSFDQPFVVQDSFFVSVVLPISTGDTIAILSTADGCRAYSGWSWEQWSNEAWHSILNSWLVDIDLAIFPVLDLPFNVGIQPEPSNTSSANVFPNPATGFANIRFYANEKGIAEISLYNAMGELLQHQSNNLMVGEHHQIIDLTGIPNGSYFIKVNIGKEQKVYPLFVQ